MHIIKQASKQQANQKTCKLLKYNFNILGGMKQKMC